MAATVAFQLWWITECGSFSALLLALLGWAGLTGSAALFLRRFRPQWWRGYALHLVLGAVVSIVTAP